MGFIFGCGLFGIGFVILAYVFHDIGQDVKSRRAEKEQRIIAGSRRTRV